MFIKVYLISLPIFLVVDMIWLLLVAKDFYSKQIGFLISSDVNFVAAFIFYLLFIAGVCVFVILPSLKQGSLKDAVILGAFFGLVSYSVYDLTNLATIKSWPLLVTIVDLLWGTFVSAFVSLVTYLIAKKIGF